MSIDEMYYDNMLQALMIALSDYNQFIDILYYIGDIENSKRKIKHFNYINEMIYTLKLNDSPSLPEFKDISKIIANYQAAFSLFKPLLHDQDYKELKHTFNPEKNEEIDKFARFDLSTIFKILTLLTIISIFFVALLLLF